MDKTGVHFIVPVWSAMNTFVMLSGFITCASSFRKVTTPTGRSMLIQRTISNLASRGNVAAPTLRDDKLGALLGLRVYELVLALSCPIRPPKPLNCLNVMDFGPPSSLLILELDNSSYTSWLDQQPALSQITSQTSLLQASSTLTVSNRCFTDVKATSRLAQPVKYKTRYIVVFARGSLVTVNSNSTITIGKQIFRQLVSVTHAKCISYHKEIRCYY